MVDLHRIAIFVLLLTAMLPLQAHAQATDCYERVYDTAHLKKHTLQEITKMRLRLRSSQGGTGQSVLAGDIAAAFRESPAYLSSNVECVADGEDMTCEILAEGGGFRFSKSVKGLRLVNTSMMRFGDEESGISIGRESEHRTFILPPSPCRE